MYHLTVEQAKKTTGGFLGLSVADMKYLTTVTSCAVPQILLPIIFNELSVKSDTLVAKTVPHILSVFATGAGLLAGNNLFADLNQELDKNKTIIG